MGGPDFISGIATRRDRGPLRRLWITPLAGRAVIDASDETTSKVWQAKSSTGGIPAPGGADGGEQFATGLDSHFATIAKNPTLCFRNGRRRTAKGNDRTDGNSRAAVVCGLAICAAGPTHAHPNGDRHQQCQN